MKFSTILLAIGLATTSAARPSQGQVPKQDIASLPPAHEVVTLQPRGLIDDMKMKDKCKSTFKADKAKYRDACVDNKQDEDARNLCLLRALLGDAPAECTKAMVKAMDFYDY